VDQRWCRLFFNILEVVMNRRGALKGLGAVGLGSVVLPGVTEGATRAARDLSRAGMVRDGVCWLTPALTEGPYYFNPNLVRQDITEGRPGMPFRMAITVINYDCDPIPNVLVDIWHCDKDGVYSGFGGTTGQTFMRGIQPTDAAGVAVFDTIYPGWYPGRATHIHFKVRLTSVSYVTSQYCFLDSVNNAVYATPLYVGRGPNPTTNALDNIFHNPNPQYLVMTAAPGGAGYEGTYTIGINLPTGIGEKQPLPNEFLLRQNYPNPFNPATTIEYYLPASSEVQLAVYDVFGREVARLVDRRQEAGTHSAVFDAKNLSSGFYFYKLVAGRFVQTKEMLLLK
jgi:protocatechuate 3,4-dioxygenase beta subunit